MLSCNFPEGSVMIAVTGATGHLGAGVLENLLKRMPASHLIASVRRPSESRAFAARGVRVREGDFDKPELLEQSFNGAERLLLISSSGIEYEKRFEQHRRVIDAGRNAGIRHIYYTSLLPGQGSMAYVMKAHLGTEAYLKSCGLTYTIIKNGVYIEVHDLYLGPEKFGQIAIPADGPISWVSRTDLAEGIARLLESGAYRNETVYLTGAAALDIEAFAALVGRHRGVPLMRKIVSLEEYVARLRTAGHDEDFARHWATTYSDLPRGEFARVDPLLRELLGRQPTSIEKVLKA
jgi:uncharacterized protein YbjT (DUF2867 family)